MKSWSAKTYRPSTGNQFGPSSGDVVNLSLFTNLDLAHEELPRVFPCVPRVGDRIRSSMSHSASPAYRLTLEVTGVTYVDDDRVEIELHLPAWCLPYGENGEKSLKAWYKQIYEKVTGRWFI